MLSETAALNNIKLFRKVHLNEINETLELLSSIHTEAPPALAEAIELPQQDQPAEPSNPKENQSREAFKALMKTYAPSVDAFDDKLLQQKDDSERRDILLHLQHEYPEDAFDSSLSLPELRFELHRRRSLQEENEHIEFMQSILLVVLYGIEFINRKMQILNLNGWANHASKDLSKHQRTLKVLHLRYFKKRMSDPVAELGWALVGSMIVFHFSNTAAETPTASAGQKPAFSGNDISNVLKLFGQIF